MKKENIQIAIDGPAAAGKSTVAKKIAQELSFIYIDTGAMYRALTYKALTKGVNVMDEQSLDQLLKQTTIDLTVHNNRQRVMLDGNDVTTEIRSELITKHVSSIAKFVTIREEMTKRQRAFSMKYSVVMDGRDIGTHVLPNADLKFFLIASVEERAKRRHEENLTYGFPSKLEDLIEEIKARDYADQTRDVAPLKKAKDAIEIDTTGLSINEVVSLMLEEINKKLNML